jgi:phosphoglycolate phosphatase-like HAD superfamily hydrolase
MAGRIRLIVFDLDGTLIDSTQDLASAVNATLARLAPGSAPLPIEVVARIHRQTARGSSWRAAWPSSASRPPSTTAYSVFLERYRDACSTPPACMGESRRPSRVWLRGHLRSSRTSPES